MDTTVLKKLSKWAELVMYVIASQPDVAQDDRNQIGQATKDLQDAIQDVFVPRPLSLHPGKQLRNLRITNVMDGDDLIAVELSDGTDTWFYDFDQSRYPGLRVGKVPRKNLNEDYLRVLQLDYSGE